MENGADIQAYLADKTGQRTVPNIFIKGQVRRKPRPLRAGLPALAVLLLTAFLAVVAAHRRLGRPDQGQGVGQARRAHQSLSLTSPPAQSRASVLSVPPPRR
jgi:hypothetical protein